MHKLYCLLIAVILLSCGNDKAQKAKQANGPMGYNLEEPQKFIMPDRLLEVSGISFNEGNPDSIFAEQDEEGKLFVLKLEEKKMRASKFAKRGDYEDLAILNNVVVMLRSDGTIFSFPLSASYEEDIPGVIEWEALLPDGEFEGLYGDSKERLIYALCKKCHVDKNSETSSGTILQLVGDSSIVVKGTFTIPMGPIARLADEGEFRFAPSALASNPRTGEWYILSSVNKLLVVTDKNWNAKEVYHLDPARFRQPEGICFDKESNLYISNEGDELSNGNVLKFAYNMTK